MEGPRIAVVGHLGKDKLCTLKKPLSELFGSTCPYEESIKFTETRKRVGFSPEELIRILDENSVDVRWGYGGRAGNVAYQLALLGGQPILISEVGKDFDKEYPGFWDGSYKTHLRKNGVYLWLKAIENEHEVGNLDLDSVGTLLCMDKEVAEIVCVTDGKHNLFFIDDQTAATVLAEKRQVPTAILESVDAVFVTSGSPRFNTAVMEKAKELGKETYWDVGFFDLNGDYVRKAVELAGTIFCNSVELGVICELSGYSVGELAKRGRVVVHEKTEGRATVYENGREVYSGAVKIEKKISPIGCCDGFSAGFTLFDLEGRHPEDCLYAGLIISANIYAHEDVQSGMLRRSEVERRMKELLVSQMYCSDGSVYER